MSATPLMTPEEAHLETLRLIVGAERQLVELQGRLAQIRALLPRIDDVADQVEKRGFGGD